MPDNDSEEVRVLEADIVQLVKLAATGNATGAHASLRKFARRYKASAPGVARAIVETLRDGPLRSTGTGISLSQPIDDESRLPLVREENPVSLENEPIFDATVESTLAQIVAEHRSVDRLLSVGLAPSRTALLVGPPGVGKTLAARWIARELGLPLLVLDLSSVMSSFLGRTGVNVRRVLDYARSIPAVLLLDELDAVAKRRDDSTEIGELKRLVTVLLQEIDSWPDGSLLLAATNHSELLDPAVWRRFDVVLDLSLPSQRALAYGVSVFLDEPSAPADAISMISNLYVGESMSRLERDTFRARRIAAMNGGSAVEELLRLAALRVSELPANERGPAAARLLELTQMSQRAVHELTGVSRDTLRKYVGNGNKGGSDGGQ